MTISTRGRYALRLMVDLAERNEEGFIALKDIAERQQISKKYLEQIIPVLTRAGLLITSRGFQGGYKLSKPAKDYTVGEIIRATEGNLSPVGCMVGDENLCPRKDACKTLPLWQGLKKVVDEYFDGITLQEVVDKELT